MDRESQLVTAWRYCKEMQQLALIPPGKSTKVGAAILGLGFRSKFDLKFYGGTNIVLSTSHNYHAEIAALLACMSNHRKPLEIFVTSTSSLEDIRLCLDCRARLIEANPDIKLTIFNPDGIVKYHGRIIDNSNNIMELDSSKIDWNKIHKMDRKFCE